MLLDLKLMFVAFSAGRLPFPNLRFLRGKSVDFADRFFPFIPHVCILTFDLSTNAHAHAHRYAPSGKLVVQVQYRK